MKKDLKVIGWREWLSLPDLKLPLIKAKIDTGAKTSALHAFDVKTYTRNGVEYVRFKVHPIQKNNRDAVTCRCKLSGYKKVRSSNGKVEQRPVVIVDVLLLGETWPIEVTLTNRDEMGFRMLLGRAAIKNRFLVNVGKSYYSKKKICKISKGSV